MLEGSREAGVQFFQALGRRLAKRLLLNRLNNLLDLSKAGGNLLLKFIDLRLLLGLIEGLRLIGCGGGAGFLLLESVDHLLQFAEPFASPTGVPLLECCRYFIESRFEFLPDR